MLHTSPCITKLTNTLPTLILVCATWIGATQSSFSAEIIFNEDFESYAPGSNLRGQGGWVEAGLSGVSWVEIGTNSHLATQGLTGNPTTGLNREDVLEHPITLNYGGITTLRFNAYARTTPLPSTHNQSVGFVPLGRAADGALPDPYGTNYPQAVWSVTRTGGVYRWQFYTAGHYFDTVGGYDVGADMRIVVDGFNNRIYGQYDFGQGLQETPHYKVSPEFIAQLTALHIYVDRRDPASTSGMEGDNINVSVQSPIKIRPSEMEICWYAEADATYRIDYQSDLTGTNWFPLINCVQGSGAPKIITNKIPPNESYRFYRIIETNCVPVP